jgi:hypothetical protein
MSSYNYLFLTIFAIIAWLMIIDQNVSEYINLIFKILRINIIRFIWMIKFHPKNPITNFIMARKYENLAKEMEKEFMKDK